MESVTVTVHECSGERQRVAEECEGELPTAGSPTQERDDAILGRQSPVDVENGDDGTAGRGSGTAERGYTLDA